MNGPVFVFGLRPSLRARAALSTRVRPVTLSLSWPVLPRLLFPTARAALPGRSRSFRFSAVHCQYLRTCFRCFTVRWAAVCEILNPFPTGSGGMGPNCLLWDIVKGSLEKSMLGASNLSRAGWVFQGPGRSGGLSLRRRSGHNPPNILQIGVPLTTAEAVAPTKSGSVSQTAPGRPRSEHDADGPWQIRHTHHGYVLLRVHFA